MSHKILSYSRTLIPIMLICGCILLTINRCGNRQQFTEMKSGKTGITFVNTITETEHTNILTYEYTYNGAGVAVGDINNDGLADIYFSGNTVLNVLYLNKGQWKFEDITGQSHTAGRRDWKAGVTMADVNGDGWLDIYVCYSGNAPGEGYNKPVVRDYAPRANQLFINNGCEKGGIPTFTDKAKEYGLDAIGTFSTQAYFFDYDRDGDLDMFLLNHANMFYSAYFNVKRLRGLRHPYFGNKLYRNDNGHYKEVSADAGIHGSGLNFGLSASIGDINRDGWPDIYVTNDYEEQDFCYINNHDGTFREVSHTIFGHLSRFGMGSDMADINNDGWPDLFVADMLPEDNYRQKLLKAADDYDKHTLGVDSGYHHQYMRNTLQISRGMAPDSLPRFSEVGQLAGVSNTDWSWAPLFADFDNDGLRDLFISNGYLRDFTNMDFTKYTMDDAMKEARKNNREVDNLALIQKMSSTKLSKYIFRNVDGIHFTNETEAWGLGRKSVYNAAAYADLDNDGDLDLIVNTNDDAVSILQNHSESIQKNNYIRIKLVGNKSNALGIGAQVRVLLGSKALYHENYITRGYQSSVDPIITLGTGTVAVIPEITVQWSDGTVSTVHNVNANSQIDIKQEGASAKGVPSVAVYHEPVVNDVTVASGIDFAHRENDYIDFKVQRLAPYQLSRLGGKLATGDVNGDGNDDIYFGGAAGQVGALYLGQTDGTFIKAPVQPGYEDRYSEDMGALFFDADGDKDLDLYVVSGGAEFMIEDPFYQDRLYINDGKGNFTRDFRAIPQEATSGSCVIAADYDHDGDLDLFVGGRLVPQYYPFVPKSYILRNDSHNGTVKFTDVTASYGKDVQKAGMITAATWADINADGWQDLIVAGEWMPVKVFINEQGKSFRNDTEAAALSKYSGWWSALTVADVDGDGDLDLLAGNAGTNLQMRASLTEPMQCYTQDLNSDGQTDPILCYYIQGKSYPMPSRDELLEQVTPLRKKFIKYDDYGKAGIDDILSKEAREKSYVASVTTLESVWFENTGGKFTMKALPAMVQASCVNAFIVDDFDGDGVTEVLAAGNFYPYRVQLGRCDASFGTLLQFGNGQASVYKAEAPLWLSGDIRGAAVVRSAKGVKHLVVSRNDDRAGVYRLPQEKGKTIQ